MNDLERFLAVMHYQSPDRGMYLMPWFGFPETLEKWAKEEGFHESDLKRYKTDHWNYTCDLFMPHPPFEYQVVEEDERHVLYINREGILLREFKENPYSSMPQFVRFPVQTREEFRVYARERLQPDLSRRIGPDWIEILKIWKKYPSAFGIRDLAQAKAHIADASSHPGAPAAARPEPFWLNTDRWGGFFGSLRNLFGVQELCKMFYYDPAFLEEMMDTIADFLIEMARQFLDHIEIEVFALWEDMGFKQGPLISPDLVRRYMLPRYKRVIDYVRGRGVKLIALDSDGQIDSLIPIWLEAGVNLLYPIEVNAGMDVCEVRKKYGRELRMFGGIDKRPLTQGPKAIDAEIARVMPVIEDGGIAAMPDHSIPPDVSYANFRYYMERMAKALGVD